MADPYLPVEIVRESASRELVVMWEDGHVSRYPYAYLRERCPCAECAVLREQPRDRLRVIAGPVVSAPAMTDIQLVGRYGIEPTWNDGHRMGIYDFEMLRRLCPCADCAG